MEVDAVLSDLHMPGGGGVPLLAECRRRKPWMARMLFTGRPDMDAALDAVNLGGATHLFSKPLDPLRLLEVLRQEFGCLR